MNEIRKIAGALALLVSMAGVAGAQQQAASTAPWRAWIGCWTAADGALAGAPTTQPLVCVSPTSSPDAVRITTVAEGKVVSAQTLDASGREGPVEATACTGTQSARWSSDARRIYHSARVTCDGVAQTVVGILAMSPTGEWIDVRGVQDAGGERLMTMRYRSAAVRADVPADVASSLTHAELAMVSARARAGADIGATAVVEAARQTSVAVTEAFVLERGQRFDLDAQQLLALADAGVSPRLTDAMIAVSNPRHFAVGAPAAPVTDTALAGRRVYVTLDRYSPWGMDYDRYGYGRYGYDRYGYGPSRYGYERFGYGYYGYGGYGYGVPVVIVRAGEASRQPQGRMVKGQGVQPAGGTSTGETRTARPRQSSPPPSSSAGSSGSSSSSSSSSSERTAKPRP